EGLRAGRGRGGLGEDRANGDGRRPGARFWNADGRPDFAAHTTLHEALETVTPLLAPMTPFLAAAMYGNLARTDESVHFADWPTLEPTARDVALEEEMARARTVVSLGLSARMEAAMKVRQPLRRALVLLPDDATFSDAVAREVADELNVKQLEMVSSLDGLLDYTVVPNFRALGPKIGKRVPLAKDALGRADGATVHRALSDAGHYTLELDDGTSVELGVDDVEVRARSHEELA